MTNEFRELLASMPADNPGVEWIIVHDGDISSVASGTNLDLPAYARFLDGDDAGATAAINKGVTAANGRFLLFLMGDDLLIDAGIAGLLETIETDASTEIFTGCVDFFSGEPGAFRATAGNPPFLDWSRIMYGRPCLGPRAFRADLFRKYGAFDTNYIYCSDREFLGRLMIAGVRERSVPAPLYRYRVHKGSQTMGGNAARIVQYVDQHRQLSSMWARRHEGAACDRFTVWHAYESARLYYYLIMCGRPLEAMFALFRQTIRNPGWLLRLRHGRKLAHTVARTDSALGP